MFKRILIVGNEENFVEKVIFKENIDIVNLYSYKYRFLVKMFSFLHINALKIYYKFKKINIHQYDVVIIFEALNSMELINCFFNMHAKKKIIYWYWNPVSKYSSNKLGIWNSENKKLINFWQKNKDKFEIWSFDKNDCKKYGFKYNTQVCKKFEISSKKVLLYDVFFCGQDKGRLNDLLCVLSLCKKNNLSIKCILLGEKYKPLSEITFINNMLDYTQVLKYIEQSRCLIDIVQVGQTGLTWRPLEALFYSKKLITNNYSIMEYDFYNKNNIYILEKDNDVDLLQFVLSPYEPVPDYIIERYMLKNWINQFM